MLSVLGDEGEYRRDEGEIRREHGLHGKRPFRPYPIKVRELSSSSPINSYNSLLLSA